MEEQEIAMMIMEAATVDSVLRSDELSCPSCIGKIEKALKALPGVESARVHFNAGRIEVRHDPAQATVHQLVEAVRRVGYKARPAAF
ncbi:MAG TPA: heavy metal-associated domain-containing protein [Gemmatimonadales bacterium]|nr:heavy metal-associated domain-containing protein [Gemmatimonadales bacterium]